MSNTWLIGRDELSNEQVRAVELDTDQHKVIFGGPGSGKTIVLLHRAKYLCDIYNIPKDKFKIFVFNNVLKSYIKSALNLLGLPEDSVMTFDNWCTDFYKRFINSRLPKVDRGIDYAKTRKDCLEYIKKNNSQLSLFKNIFLYEFILVDEGQDLDNTSFQLMKIVSKHVTVCMDNKQRIYENGSNEKDITNALGVKKRNISFLETFRVSPFIADLAAELIENKEEKSQFIHQCKIEQSEKQTPLLYYASDYEDEKRELLDVIRTRQIKGDRIAILFHYNKHVYGYAKGLKEEGFDIEVPKESHSNDYISVDFNSDRPKILTYHSAKGLTFDTVIMPQLVKRNFFNRGEDEIKRLLFVGITRATKWVYLSSYLNYHLSILKNFSSLAVQGCLTIRQANDSVSQDEYIKSDEPDILDIL